MRGLLIYFSSTLGPDIVREWESLQILSVTGASTRRKTWLGYLGEDYKFRNSWQPILMTPNIKYWIPALCVGLFISLFSTRFFSDEQTARAILPVLRWVFPGAASHMLHLMHIGIRKLAHITEFGVFSITVFHGARGGRSGWRLDRAVVTLLIAVAYAALDEFHQSYVPVRHASLRDVAIDAFGALLVQSIVWIYARLRRGESLEMPLYSNTAKD